MSRQNSIPWLQGGVGEIELGGQGIFIQAGLSVYSYTYPPLGKSCTNFLRVSEVKRSTILYPWQDVCLTLTASSLVRSMF